MKKSNDLSKSFKELHTFDKRKRESERVKEKYPNRVPVICERAGKSNVPLIDKKKYLVPQDLSIGQFMYVVRKRIKISPEKAVFIFVDGILPPVSDQLSKVYEEHKDEDGFLYFTYSGENTFGKLLYRTLYASIMEIKPTDLKAKFNQVFEKHRELEESEEFQSKKRKHQDLNLESKHNTNTLSEIFQDPDLLARISEDAHMIMRETAVRASRVRHEHDIITQKKPQAKDVITRRLVGDEIVDIYDTLETVIDGDNEYLNPIAPKRRKYLAEESGDITPASSASSSPQETAPEMNLSVPMEPLSITNNGISLALPIIQKPAEPVHTNEQKEKSELEQLLEETSIAIKQSPLKTVGSKHLYTLLPRQCEINAYRYVKEDYTPVENQIKQINADIKETLITITIFNPQNSNLKFQEIEILGSQSFTDLRDTMYCTSDFLRNGNKRDQAADGEVINTPQKKLSPSMIYMDHVFYIDTRDASSTSYDSLIHTWMTKKRVNTDVFRFEKKDMQTAVLQDISLKFHQPVAFIHQNDCEHMMVIQDIKLVSESEYKSKTEFPRTTHNLRYDRYKCSMCTVFPATKITYEDIISGFSPCYFCDICFESFHVGDTNVSTVEYAGVPGGEIKARQNKKGHKKSHSKACF